jgi:hypothetical protein
MATLEWQKPTVTEIKMDAEISSYQEDERDPFRDSPPICESVAREGAVPRKDASIKI